MDRTCSSASLECLRLKFWATVTNYWSSYKYPGWSSPRFRILMEFWEHSEKLKNSFWTKQFFRYIRCWWNTATTYRPKSESMLDVFWSEAGTTSTGSIGTKEQQLYFKLPPNVWASQTIPKGERCYPTEGTHFSRLYQQSIFFSYYPKLVTIDEG